jgi:hypothetical protein
MTRADVVAIIGGLSGLSGAIAGAAAALVGAAVLTPTEPVTAGQIAMMATQNALVFGLAGMVVGTLAAFGFMRRVPLRRLIACTTLGTTAGLIAGWLGGPWAWHHFSLLGFVGFSTGAVLARAIDLPRTRGGSRRRMTNSSAAVSLPSRNSGNEAARMR